MDSITSQHVTSILRLTILSILFLFIIDGCEKESGPTGPIDTPTIPSVNGHWVGNDHAIFGGTTVRDWALQVDITQSGSSLVGTWLYTLTTAGPFQNTQTRAGFKGTITMSGQVAFAETSYVALNWSGQNWGLNSYSGALSSKRDTISGKGTSDTLNVKDTFFLVKQ